MWNQKKNWETFLCIYYCIYCLYISYVLAKEFMLKIYHHNINLGMTVHNSKGSSVNFSRNIHLLMSTSIVIIDQTFGMIYRFCCNHIPFTQLRHDYSIPQFVCDLSYFSADSKCSHLWRFSSPSPSPQKKQFGMKFCKLTFLQLTPFLLFYF